MIEISGPEVSLSGLTIAGGTTGILCATYVRAIGEDLSIRDNLPSGGLFLDWGCHMTLTGSELSWNQGEYGGGARVYGGAWLDLVDSTVEGNVASAGGGFHNQSSTVVLDRTLVRDNESWFIPSAYWGWAGSVLVCLGDTTGAYGFHSNDGGQDGVGALLLNTTMDSLYAVQCDFGADGGADDNQDFDIMQADGMGDTLYEFGDDATFFCVDGACR